MEYGKLKIYKLDGNIVSYDVEIPQNDEEFYVGLSYKDFILEKTGMLYNYLNSYPQKARMFTPDTKMSVDFIFLDNAGTIIKIHKKAKPLSKKIISCYSVGFVLEVNAGDCDKYGIQLGDVAIIPFKTENKMFSPCEIKNLTYKKLGNEVFAITDDEKYYMYSYKGHCWFYVDDSFEARFKDIIQISRRFLEEENLSEKEANEFAINYDKQLLLDYRKYKKRYYQNGRYLIYEYTPETGNFRYYKLKSGWQGWKHNEISCIKFQEIRETSQILTKKAVEILVKEAENKLTKNEIDKINRQNFEEYSNLECGLLAYCHCFYKENDSLGWIHSFMYGDKTICEQRLEKLKNNKKIYDYKVYGGSYSIIKYNTELSPTLPSANDTHLLSNWIIMPDENKIYLEDEIVKEPENKPKETKNITMSIRQTPCLSFDPNDFENEQEIYSNASFSIKTDFQKEGKYIIITDDFIADIPNFLENLDKNKFAVLHNEEYSYFKLLAWEKDDGKIRFIMQSYGDFDVKTPIDTIVKKETLLICFEKLKKSYERLHEKNLKIYRQVCKNQNT